VIAGRVAILAALFAAAPARADDGERELVAAARSGERERLARAAEHLGPARLGRLIASTSAETERAALLAAPELDDGWTLLPLVVERLSSPEGARAAARIAHPLREPSIRETLEVDDDVLDAARRRCTEAMASAGMAPAARADLLACAVDLGEPAAATHLFDPDPEVRDTAISLLSASPDDTWREPMLKAARGGDPTTAGPALGALCTHNPARTMASLDAPARKQLKALAAKADPTLKTALTLCLRRK